MFILGLVFRVLNRYILPIFRITNAASAKMREMQEQMRHMENNINNTNNTQKVNNPPPKRDTKIDGDYIDYEEVR